jgi:hypothetical protein
LATICYKVGATPNLNNKPIVNFLLSKFEAQLASTYPFAIVSIVVGKKMSLLLVPFKYQTIHFTTCKCAYWSADMYLDTQLIV